MLSGHKIRSFRNFPIQRKLMAISLLASSVALALACLGFLTYESLAYSDATRQRLASVAAVISANTGAALRFDDSRAAELTLSGLMAEHQVLAACIYSIDGDRLATYLRESAELRCPDRDPRRRGDPAHQSGVVLVAPIADYGEELGTIWIQSEPIQSLDRVTHYASIILAVMLASVGVAFLLSSRLQGLISAPILRLVETAREVSSGKDFSLRARKEGDDEVGLLIESFNDMLAHIQERDRELAQSRELLEESVAERTAGLMSAVEELHAEIEQRKKAEERIRYLAYYDVLTGLPNREFLKERIVGALRDARRDSHPLALLFLDLDRFKEINDSFGHSVGDLLLRNVADRIERCVRRSDFVALEHDEGDSPSTVSRQGGDEFTILLAKIRSGLDASRVASRVLQALEDPVSIGDREVVVGASIGIAVYPNDGEDADALLKHADTAMYHAKASGRNDFQYFSESMKEAALQKVTLENDLRKAIERHEFLLHYQPKLSVRSGMIESVEALLRWDRPGHGVVRPSEFVSVAEESGLVVPIGNWVLKAACRQCVAWRNQGIGDIRVAVNVSGLQFRKNSLLGIIREILNETEMDPHMLELEITESTMVQDDDRAIESLKSLRRLGVRVALDDFGTGYSSLSHVRRLPLDALKIDQSFTAELGVNPETSSIVTAIISMAHSLGLSVVAEGVENADQLDFLRAQGCEELQGYYLGMPAGADRIAADIVRKNDQ